MLSPPIQRAFSRFQKVGDPAALALVFDALAPRLLLLAAHLTRDPSQAEDLVQATFLGAIENVERWDGERSVAAWLSSILRHKAIDAQRKGAGRAPGSLVGEVLMDSTPLQLAQESELFTQVEAAVEQLGSPYREVLLLRLLHGLEPTAIAHSLGRSPSAVRMQLKRGLERLRGVLPRNLAALVAWAGLPEGGLREVREAVLGSAKSKAAHSSAVLLGGIMTIKACMGLLLGLLVAGLVYMRSGQVPESAAMELVPVEVIVPDPLATVESVGTESQRQIPQSEVQVEANGEAVQVDQAPQNVLQLAVVDKESQAPLKDVEVWIEPPIVPYSRGLYPTYPLVHAPKKKWSLYARGKSPLTLQPLEGTHRVWARASGYTMQWAPLPLRESDQTIELLPAGTLILEVVKNSAVFSRVQAEIQTVAGLIDIDFDPLDPQRIDGVAAGPIDLRLRVKSEVDGGRVLLEQPFMLGHEEVKVITVDPVATDSLETMANCTLRFLRSPVLEGESRWRAYFRSPDSGSEHSVRLDPWGPELEGPNLRFEKFLPNLQPGTYRLSISPIGFVRDVELRAGEGRIELIDLRDLVILELFPEGANGAAAPDESISFLFGPAKDWNCWEETVGNSHFEKGKPQRIRTMPGDLKLCLSSWPEWKIEPEVIHVRKGKSQQVSVVLTRREQHSVKLGFSREGVAIPITEDFLPLRFTAKEPDGRVLRVRYQPNGGVNQSRIWEHYQVTVETPGSYQLEVPGEGTYDVTIEPGSSEKTIELDWAMM